MIYLSNINDKITKEYLNSDSKNPFAVGVKGLLKAYGAYPKLCSFWYQTDNSNKITAYIVKYGGEYIADILENADVKEIIDMCCLAGGTALLCKSIGYGGETGVAMKLNRLQTSSTGFELSEAVNLSEYYKILQSNNSPDFEVPQFEDFYVDLNHRLRKQASEIMGAYFNGTLVSCCVVTATDNNSALLAGVTTLPQYKKQGFGTAVVTKICESLILKGKENIFLYRDQNKNFSFYNKIGFQDFSKFEQIKLY